MPLATRRSLTSAANTRANTNPGVGPHFARVALVANRRRLRIVGVGRCWRGRPGGGLYLTYRTARGSLTLSARYTAAMVDSGGRRPIETGMIVASLTSSAGTAGCQSTARRRVAAGRRKGRRSSRCRGRTPVQVQVVGWRDGLGVVAEESVRTGPHGAGRLWSGARPI